MLSIAFLDYYAEFAVRSLYYSKMVSPHYNYSWPFVLILMAVLASKSFPKGLPNIGQNASDHDIPHGPTIRHDRVA